MKKYILVAFFQVFSAQIILACGPYWEPVFSNFFHLFVDDQDKLGDCNCGSEGNISEWEAYFGASYPNVTDIVYGLSIRQVEQLLKKESNVKYIEAFEYLIFAKNFHYNSNKKGQESRYHSWDYLTILQKDKYQLYEDFISEGLIGYNATTNKTLKMRYAYQVIRHLHYTGKFAEAVSFFEEYVPVLELKNEMFYYCLDQVSGCHFKLGNRVEAAYGFMKVVGNSQDRRRSAEMSFHAGYRWEFEAVLKKCINDEEKVLTRRLTSRDFYSYDDAVWILDNSFNESALLAIYYNYDAHENGKYNWMNKNNFLRRRQFGEDYINVKNNISVLKRILANKKTEKLDFWNLCIAHQYYHLGQFSLARKHVNSIKELTIVSQSRFDFFKKLYSINFSGYVNNKVENQLYEIFEGLPLKDKNDKLTDMFYSSLKTYYYTKGNVFKGDLLTQTKRDVNQIYDIKTLDKFKKLYHKKDKSRMEEYLLKNCFADSSFNLNDYINEKKASYYMMRRDFQKAKVFYNKLPEDFIIDIFRFRGGKSPRFQFDGYTNISNQIFSINTKENYYIHGDIVLNDTIYKKPKFNFIKKYFSKKELNNYLIKLTIKARNNDFEANYLLGNYYYNTSQYGYFRNILIYKESYSIHPYRRYRESLSDYNKTSNEFYSKALSLTKNMELKAKITFLSAKNVAYAGTKERRYRKGAQFERCQPFFDELKTKYKDTEFYDEIIKECSVFTHYVNK